VKEIKDDESTLTLIGAFEDRLVNKWTIFHLGKFVSVGFGEDFTNNHVALNSQLVDGLMIGLLKSASILCTPMEQMSITALLEQEYRQNAARPITVDSKGYLLSSAFGQKMSVTTIGSINAPTTVEVYLTANSKLNLKIKSRNIAQVIKALVEMTGPRLPDQNLIRRWAVIYDELSAAAVINDL